MNTYQGISEPLALRLYYIMQRIRKFELAVIELFARGKMPGFLHTYVGEEAVAAGVCANLRVEDKITSTHRGHGHLLAKGGRMDLAMAELYAKRTGYNKGKGGSMHIAEPDLGMLGANAIVGAGLVMVNGAALSAQYLGTDNIAVCFFGDGASNEGTFHEGLNLASVWNLPTIFVCENNGYGESTPQRQHQKIKDIAIRAVSYDIPAIMVNGDDVGAVYLAAQEAVQRGRSGGGPTLIEAKTHRWRGHHEADTQHYRPKEELQALPGHCPIEYWRNLLVQRGISQAILEQLYAEVEQELEQAIDFAEKSPPPDPAEARSDIFTPFEEELSLCQK
jgi:TPP-dependent pyruvate/acetoin dehydrogenase alpha subunit